MAGGAARAAYRIHHSLREQRIISRMWVDKASAGDWTVEGPRSRLEKAMAILRPQVGALLARSLKTDNPIIHSPQVLPSRWVERVNVSDADIVHLHWVQAEMLSIAEIGKIRKPIVWTLHDMWAFCGAEHIAWDERWREGYRSDNRPVHESGFDLNRWVWNRKRKHWQRPIHLVAPSRWMANCVQESALMRGWQVDIIPNPIDVEKWKPLPKNLARELLGLTVGAPLLLFGAMGGGVAHHKGFDLLLRALSHLRDSGQVHGLELVIFGQLQPQNVPELGFPIHYMGQLHDDLSLRALYSAADVFVLPSRQDNLPNTGVESLACGTPVVAFNTCGVPDIVTHSVTGYLANPFEATDLARGILWVLSDKHLHAELSSHARAYAVEHFASQTVAAKYKALYERVASQYASS